MNTKSVLGSKTVWLNFITFLLVILALPEFVSVIPDTAIPWIALVSAILNAILRIFFTDKPITTVLPPEGFEE